MLIFINLIVWGTEMEAEHANFEVLLLEDQALIAIYVEELLHQACFQTVNTVSSCLAAAEWLQSHTPGLAVIETRLRDGQCDAVAQMLESRGVPYLVHTAGSERGDPSHGSLQQTCAWLPKPCDPDDFHAAIRHCLSECVVH